MIMSLADALTSRHLVQDVNESQHHYTSLMISADMLNIMYAEILAASLSSVVG